MPKRIDLTGQRFGRLVVKNFSHKDKHRHIMWTCVCDCGNISIVNTYTLISGEAQSCGCLRKEILSSRPSFFLGKHSLCSSSLYRIWIGMIQRVSNPNSTGYVNYGGRGITVCKEWEEDFQAFYNWSMSHGYQKGLTIDRIDVNGGYCPKNCRWATRKQQANNMRKTIKIEYDGRSLTISEAAELYGISRTMLEQRIRSGWSAQEAIELPPYTHRKKKK